MPPNRRIGQPSSTEDALLWDIDKQLERLIQVVAAAEAGDGTVTSVTGTANRITITGTPTISPIVDIAATYVGQASITTVGTLTSGATGAGFTVALSISTITGTLGAARGGTGVPNNAASTITISGAFATTFTVTNTTSVTLPTSGTLVNSTQAWLAASGTTFTGNNVLTGTGFTLKGIWDGLGVTQTLGYGLWSANTTPAALGAQQISPSISLEGQGWATGVNNSQSVKFLVDVLPIQAATNPTASLRFSSSINGAAFGSVLTIGNTGTINTSGSLIVSGTGTFSNSVAVTGSNNSYSNSAALSTTGTRHFVASGAVSGGGSNEGFLHSSTINSSAGSFTTFQSSMIITALTTLIGFDHNPTNPSNVSGTHLAFRGTTGSILLGDTTKGANTGAKVVIISNASTNATAAQTNGIVLHAKDSSAGSANSTLALYTEEAPEATATFTQTHRIRVWWNNVEYWLSLDSV